MAMQVEVGIASTVMVTCWPGRMPSSSVSLKLAVIQTSVVTSDITCWPAVR